MFYRRKVLLNLLSMCGGEVEKIKLQKLLILFCARQEKPAYSFVPYKFGCFSFQANADLGTIQKSGVTEETETSWVLKEAIHDDWGLPHSDLIKLELVLSKYAHMSKEDLIRHTYIEYPFYALNSTLVHKLLDEKQKAAVAATVSHDKSLCLFTIGYEGRTLEEFLNTLIKHNVRVLCDVRKNALSMKYGFSKGTLSNACKNVGIAYCHVPDLGIESSERKELHTREDYRELFASYRSGVLAETQEEQNSICDLVKNEKGVALMCFEKEPEMCHRSHLAEAVINLGGRKFPLTHL